MTNVLLLGGFGFIGKNLINCFAKDDDYSIIVLDKVFLHPNDVCLKNVHKIYLGDFSDKRLLERIFEENKIDLVFHSICATIPVLSNDSLYEMTANVIPTIFLLDTMLIHGVKKIVFISSGGCIYDHSSVCPKGYSEEDVLLPKNAYGLSKLMVEQWLYFYYKKHNLQTLIVRPSNLYGPLHYSQFQGVVNIAIEKAMNKEVFFVFGDGDGTKDYILIDDFCNIVYYILQQGIIGYEVLNIGSNELISVNSILRTIKLQYFHSFEWKYFEAIETDVSSYRLNTNKLLQLIGPYSFIGFNEGLAKTLRWYQNKRI